MKKIFLVVAVLLTATMQKNFAQLVPAQREDGAAQSQTPQLLSLYYNIKDALVAGNPTAAASNAEAFVKATVGADAKSIPQSNVTALVTDATAISKSNDLKEQRHHFADLSINLFAVARSVKLTDQPVYEAFCPMKKAYWLSSSKTIKNPYFGNAMLSCGKVVETLNQ